MYVGTYKLSDEQAGKAGLAGGTYTFDAETGKMQHQYVAEIVAPDCTNVGHATYICSICGNSYEEDIPALGHTEEIIPGKAATCTESGLTEGKKCSVCDEPLSAQMVIDPLGHKDEDPKENECDKCGTFMTGVNNGYYYVDGVRTGIGGLVKWNGNYYYVSKSGKMYVGTYKLSDEQAGKAGLTGGTYTFDAETGKMIVKEVKNGVVDGYYYVDGVRTGIGGLVNWNGDYYYISKSGKVYVGTYKLSDEQAGKAGLAGGTYTFDAETGKMVNPPAVNP